MFDFACTNTLCYVQVDWLGMDTSVLNAYRQLHHLQVTPVFGTSFNERVLGRTGVCTRSPTMIRHRAHRKTNKGQTVLAVKKDFNDAMINELDSITTFLYSIHNKGTLHDCEIQPIGLIVNSR